MFWVILFNAQNKQVLYGLEEVPQSMLINPGSRIDYKYHFGVPFLSQVHFNGGASGVSAYDIFRESGGGTINDRIRSKIFELKNTDFFTATEQLDVINFGWRNNKNYYFSGGIYQELDFVLYFPKDLALLAWEGNQNYLGKEFNLGEVSTTAELLTVYHFGVNKKVNNKLTMGIRGKIYSSMLSFRSTNNQGTFVTRFSESGNNIYEHIVSNANISVKTSGITSLEKLDGSSAIVKEMIGRAFFGGNLGIGVDVGATYEINEQWTASASVLDVGAIFYTKDVESYQVKGEYTLDGLELLFPGVGDGESPPYYDDLINDIEDSFPIDTLNTSYTKMRPVKINASLKYNFGREVGGTGACNCLKMGENQEFNQSVGFQYYNTFRPKGIQAAATLFYYRKFTDYLSAKATYTVDSYSYYNLGLGIAADIGVVNFYVMLDNLQWYSNIAKAKSVSLQLGFNIIIDKNE